MSSVAIERPEARIGRDIDGNYEVRVFEAGKYSVAESFAPSERLGANDFRDGFNMALAWTVRVPNQPDPWVVIEWLAENMPRALELCPYKVRR